MGNPKVAREFFEKNLPKAVLEISDLNTLTFLKDSIVSNKLNMQIPDALFSIDIKGEQGYFYLVFEHMSSQKKMLPFRMMQYVMAVMEEHVDKKKGKSLPLVYPLVLYTGKKKYTQPLDMFELFGEHKETAKQWMTKPLHLVDLSQETDEEIRKKYYWFQLAAVVSKLIHSKDLLVCLPQIIHLMQKMEEVGEGNYNIFSIEYMDIVGEVSDVDAYNKSIVDGLSDIDEEKKMRIADYYKEEGRQEGIRKGLEQGLEKGKKEKQLEMAKKMITKHFSVKEISELTGLTKEEIQKLAH